MATQLPREDIWFAVRWRRLRAVRREGKIAMAKFAAAAIVSAFAGVLLIAFVNVFLGIAVFSAGFGLSLSWFTALQRRHTDYSITYDDYFRENNNA
jgi:hypothetical protein